MGEGGVICLPISFYRTDVCGVTKWIQLDLAQGGSRSQGLGKLSRLAKLSFLFECRVCPTEAGIRRGPSKARATVMMRGTRPTFSNPAGT